MYDDNMKEVRYDIYCERCKYHDLPETDDPCDECMKEPMNWGSEKPCMYSENKNIQQVQQRP